ncbi:PhzF family phenazine biosynthesis isomerase [Saccharopolyspora taberi]|uniref:PhzF family phenazine biosynthesis isomerase n=1 Tax=Saccharopolyspora taberi TaxID=60895 RepID=A0ABN3VGN2_9PSEU
MNNDVLRYSAFDRDGEGGNPAGVVLDATGATEQWMQRTAAEVGYSETAFLVAELGPRRYRIRYFSPLAEVAFCGHATIATAVALADRDGVGEFVLTTPAGEVAVDTRVEEGRVNATLTSVAPSVREAESADLETALAALSWDTADLDPSLPPRIANAGNDHLVLAAATRERLADLDYDQAALGALMADQHWTTVHLVWRGEDGQYHARDPFPPGGVFEDPATGAAAAAFGAYLRELGLVAPPGRVTIHQGEDMGRPSRLVVDIPPGAAGIRVSGTATAIGE